MSVVFYQGDFLTCEESRCGRVMNGKTGKSRVSQKVVREVINVNKQEDIFEAAGGGEYNVEKFGRNMSILKKMTFCEDKFHRRRY